jgi:hypothetical protein
MSGVYERAIAESSKRRFNSEPGSEEALRMFWIGYLDGVVRTSSAVSSNAKHVQRINGAGQDEQLAVLARAVRSVPAAGEVWARYLRVLVRSFCVVEVLPDSD